MCCQCGQAQADEDTQLRGSILAKAIGNDCVHSIQESFNQMKADPKIPGTKLFQHGPPAEMTDKLKDTMHVPVWQTSNGQASACANAPERSM